MFGPTVGDRLRLADTDLLIEIEKDCTVYGDEVKFGGGKVIRDGMGQSAIHTSAHGTPDLVITNVIVLGHWGIIKADVGIKNGRICGIGKAGNPLGLAKSVVPVERCRTIGKKDLLHNQALPQIDVNPETYVVKADGQILTCEPVSALPLAQRYFLF